MKWIEAIDAKVFSLLAVIISALGFILNIIIVVRAIKKDDRKLKFKVVHLNHIPQKLRNLSNAYPLLQINYRIIVTLTNITTNKIIVDYILLCSKDWAVKVTPKDLNLIDDIEFPVELVPHLPKKVLFFYGDFTGLIPQNIENVGFKKWLKFFLFNMKYHIKVVDTTGKCYWSRKVLAYIPLKFAVELSNKKPFHSDIFEAGIDERTLKEITVNELKTEYKSLFKID